jgi:hypothetical protein
MFMKKFVKLQDIRINNYGTFLAKNNNKLIDFNFLYFELFFNVFKFLRYNK